MGAGTAYAYLFHAIQLDLGDLTVYAIFNAFPTRITRINMEQAASAQPVQIKQFEPGVFARNTRTQIKQVFDVLTP